MPCSRSWGRGDRAALRRLRGGPRSPPLPSPAGRCGPRTAAAGAAPGAGCGGCRARAGPAARAERRARRCAAWPRGCPRRRRAAAASHRPRAPPRWPPASRAALRARGGHAARRRLRTQLRRPQRRCGRARRAGRAWGPSAASSQRSRRACRRASATPQQRAAAGSAEQQRRSAAGAGCTCHPPLACAGPQQQTPSLLWRGCSQARCCQRGRRSQLRPPCPPLLRRSSCLLCWPPSRGRCLPLQQRTSSGGPGGPTQSGAGRSGGAGVEARTANTEQGGSGVKRVKQQVEEAAHRKPVTPTLQTRHQAHAIKCSPAAARLWARPSPPRGVPPAAPPCTLRRSALGAAPPRGSRRSWAP